jgi:hypothetical protein
LVFGLGWKVGRSRSNRRLRRLRPPRKRNCDFEMNLVFV